MRKVPEPRGTVTCLETKTSRGQRLKLEPSEPDYHHLYIQITSVGRRVVGNRMVERFLR